MKRIAVFFALALVSSTFAQPGGPSGTGISASLLNLFGEIKAFSAKGEVRILDKKGAESTVLPVTMAMRDSKLRVEMDMTQMKGASIPSDAMAMLAQTGMDKMQMLMDGTNGTFVIYPGLQAYAPVPEDKGGAQGKVESSDVGKEDFNGHPCIKRKVAVTDAKGKTEEAFVWVATDLKNFPIKMEMQQRNNTVQITYAAPSLQTPDAALFALPGGYKKYDGIQGLMQAAMMKMFSR